MASSAQPRSTSSTPVTSTDQDVEPPSPEAGEENQEPVTMYKVIMTPVNFVTFLVSLLLVDLRYTRVRMHAHSNHGSRLPEWLHDILYRRQPYDDVGRRKAGASREEWYYHSNQKKLMKMEAEEAFKLRGTVLIFLAVLAATVTGGVLYVANRLVYSWYGWQVQG